MSVVRFSAVVAVAAVLLSTNAARAGTIALRPVRAIYVDAKEGPLKRPEGVACAAQGEAATAVVVADTGNRRVVRYTVARDATVGANVVEAKLDQLTVPQRVQLDSKGNAVVLDGKTRRLVRVGPDGGFRGFLDVKAAAPRPDVRTVSFKLGAEDAAYVLDGANARVLVADASGAVKREVALPAGLFVDVAVDAAGTLYALDAKEAAIWSADPAGAEFKRLTPSLKEYMSFPTYLAVDRASLLVVDQNGAGVVQLGIDGSYQGRALTFGNSEGLVSYPSQLCTTAAGETFVADRSNNRIQLFARPE